MLCFVDIKQASYLSKWAESLWSRRRVLKIRVKNVASHMEHQGFIQDHIDNPKKAPTYAYM